MKKRLQGLIAGILMGVIFMSGVSFAKQNSEWVELFYNNVKISMNGQEVQPQDANGNYVEPFIINGTTYLPVRAVATALGLNVGWDDSTKTVILANHENINPAIGFDASSVASEISVIKEYRWDNYIAVILKNNSVYTISPRVQVTFKDKEGNLVGAEDQSEYAFGPGNEMAFVFNNDEEFQSYEYVISASEEEYYDECVSKLECSYSMTDKKAIIQVKNNGNKPAKYVICKVLFKNNGMVVGYNYGYCNDNDSEIKPGMTEMREFSSYGEKFDSIEVYLRGKADK